MGVVFRQSIKTAIVIFSGALLGVFITLLSTRFIPIQLLGLVGNLTTQSLVVGQVLLLGLSTTLVIFVHKYEERRKNLLVTLCLIIPCIFTCIFSVIYFAAKPLVVSHFQPIDQPYIDKYYHLTPVLVLLFVLQIMFEQYLGSQMKVAIAAFFREVVLRILNLTLIILFALNVIQFDLFAVSFVTIYAVPILFYAFIALRSGGFRFSFDFKAFSKSEYIHLFKFTFYHSLLILSANLLSYLDSIALPLYDHKGLASVAVYRLSVFFISFVQMPSKAMMTPTITVLAQSVAAGDMHKARDVFERASINVLIATLLMAMIIGLNLDAVIVFIGQGYYEIKLVFFILLIGRLVDMATGLNDAILSITNYYKFTFWASLVFCGVLYLLLRTLIPLENSFGSVYGAAWSTTITMVLFNIAKYLFVWKKLGMQPFSKNTLVVLLCAVPAVAVGYFLPDFFRTGRHIYKFTFFDVTLRSTLILLVYVLMLLWLQPSDDLKTYLASIKKNKRLF